MIRKILPCRIQAKKLLRTVQSQKIQKKRQKKVKNRLKKKMNRIQKRQQ